MIFDRRIFYVEFIPFWCLIFFIENKTDFEKKQTNQKKTEEIKSGWINYIEPDFVTEKSANKKTCSVSIILQYQPTKMYT